jgi:predicted transcriptional regulator
MNVRTQSGVKGRSKSAAERASNGQTVAPPGPANALDVPDDKRGGGVQSLARAFSILEQIARSRDGINLADLSRKVGLHNSTTFHLVKTMVSLGYVRQIKDDKRYRIGRPLFALAANALDEIEMVSLATPVLEDLSRETGESGHFAVPTGDSVVVIARTDGAGRRCPPRALYGPRQGHPRGAQAGTARRLSQAGRACAGDAELHHRCRGTPEEYRGRQAKRHRLR